jgi:lipopolysaccharide export system permease protein
MKMLDKLVLKDLIPMFGVGIGMFTSLWFAGGPILEASRYLSQGFAVMIVLHLLLLNIPVVLALTFPMAMLLSVLLGFGRLSADSEAVATYAAGIPFLRVAAPAAVLGLVASLAGFILNDYVAAQASHRIADLKTNSFKERSESAQPIDLPPLRQGDVLVATAHVEKGIDLNTGMLLDVTVTTYDKMGNPSAVVHAERARWLGDKVWELQNVTINHLGPMPNYVRCSVAKSYELVQTPEMMAFLQRDPSTLTFSELQRQVRGLRAGGAANNDQVRKAEHQMWSIIALPCASLVFAVIGAPLGLRPQRSAKFTGWWLAILIIFSYYVMYTVMKSMASGGTMSPMLAAFLPDLIGLAVGAALVLKASN